MNNSLNNTKGIDKSKVLLIMTTYNIILTLIPFAVYGGYAIVIWIYTIPWTLITLLLISITNIIIDVKNISIKLNSVLVVLSLIFQILAIYITFKIGSFSVYWNMYQFIMLIALILIISAYYIGYKNRIVDNIETRKNYISYILPLLFIFSILVLGGLILYNIWSNSPAKIPQEYNENTIQSEY